MDVPEGISELATTKQSTAWVLKYPSTDPDGPHTIVGASKNGYVYFAGRGPARGGDVYPSESSAIKAAIRTLERQRRWIDRKKEHLHAKLHTLDG